MSAIIPSRRVRTQQPLGGVVAPKWAVRCGINASNFLRDIAGRYPVSVTSGISASPAAKGLATIQWSSSDHLDIATGLSASASFCVIASFNTRSGGGSVACSNAFGGWSVPYISHNSATVSAGVRAASGANYDLSYAIPTGINDVTAALAWVPSQGLSLAVNGSLVGFVAAAESGLYVTPALFSAGGGMGFSLYFGAVLAGDFRATIPALSANPYQIYVPRRRISYFDLGSGGGSTLNGSATGAAVASGAAALAAQVALSAVGVSSATGSAAGSVNVPLSATGIAVAGGTAAPAAAVTISAAALAQAAGSAGLSASVLLAGAGAAQASGNAALAVQLSALAAGAAQASGSANLSGGAPGMLSANGGAVANGQAVLSVSVNLAAAGNAVASGTANGSASAPGGLSAAGSAQADGWASWSVLTTLTAAGFVQAMGAGQLAISVPLSAAGQASASGSAAAALLGEIRNFHLAAGAPQRITRALCAAQRLTRLKHEAIHA